MNEWVLCEDKCMECRSRLLTKHFTVGLHDCPSCECKSTEPIYLCPSDSKHRGIIPAGINDRIEEYSPENNSLTLLSAKKKKEIDWSCRCGQYAYSGLISNFLDFKNEAILRGHMKHFNCRPK